jgi:hypothetical protein
MISAGQKNDPEMLNVTVQRNDKMQKNSVTAYNQCKPPENDEQRWSMPVIIKLLSPNAKDSRIRTIKYDL